LPISLHKSKRCADAIKLEGKKCGKGLLTWTGWTVAPKTLANSWGPRDPSPRASVHSGSRQECPFSFSSHLLLLSLGFAFSGFRISRGSHCSHDRGNESARFTNFLDVIPRYDRWGSVILLEHIYILSPFQIISHSKNFGEPNHLKHDLESSCSFLFEGCYCRLYLVICSTSIGVCQSNSNRLIFLFPLFYLTGESPITILAY